jgi:hypothetical protein
MTKRCRHVDSWLIAGGAYEWCYRCGAFRCLRPVRGSTNALAADSVWCRPKPNGDNPWDAWRKATVRYQQRRERV